MEQGRVFLLRKNVSTIEAVRMKEADNVGTCFQLKTGLRWRCAVLLWLISSGCCFK